MSNYTYRQYQGEMSALRDPDFLLTVQREFIAADELNRSKYNELLTKHAQLIALAIDIYGAKARQVTYLRQNNPPDPLSNRKNFEKLMRKFRTWDVQERKREQDRQYRANRRARIEQIVPTLEAAGYVLGVDFTHDNAISFAARHDIDNNEESEARPGG